MDCNLCPEGNGQAMYSAPVRIGAGWYLADLCLWHLALQGDQDQAVPLGVSA